MCSNPKNPKKYSCINCDYYTDSKKDFNKHLDTAKHKEFRSNKKGD